MKIEISGVRTPVDAGDVNEAMPDYAAFVLTEGYKKTVSEETAKILSKFMDPTIGRVGVFVNDEPARIKRLVYNGLIDIVQLHGDEDDDYINELKSGEGSIVKVFKIDGNFDLEKAEKCAADMIMFESSDQDSPVDTEKIKGCKRPFIVKESAENGKIKETVENLKGSNLFAISIGSSVGKGSNHLDAALMAQVVNEAHAC